ncbi:TPA: hypothetical protein DEP34_03775 [Candidatus Uhrbacteria bacterium]|uniref:O-antigen ligase-related protein n=2 Tax=Candidatus Uhriibacteriota TaxID=1752732 RepID=A0A0G1RNK2_9BACT|nr:MAG: O-antigen ligase-related protein [Candidatus Uhrbacteria bacterium GW2011_GWF2_46_218]HBK34243.1 hypothetical protein [Candidatus Uhrbacteria bacterium]HCB19475.1 hypothetical protein [Candidatus Uhrbacteria bacterium]
MMRGKSFAKIKGFFSRARDRQHMATGLTYAVLFLLPWQTRWIFSEGLLNGEHWEYGTFSLYAVEVIILVAIFLRGHLVWFSGLWKVQRRIILFFGACFLSLSFARFFDGALYHLLHLCFAYALFSLVVDTRVQTKMLLFSFFAGLVTPSFLAWFQVLMGNSPASTFFGLAFQDVSILGTSVIAMGGDRLLRAYGSFPHPNIFGGYFVVAIIFLMWLGWRGKKEIWLSAIAILFGSVFVLTFSRSAWLALVVGLIFIVMAAWRFHTRPPPHFQTIAFFCVIGMLAAGSIFSQAIFTRFDTSERLEALSLSERVNGYEQWGEVFLKNFVIGVGPGGYTAVLSVLFPGQSAWAYQPVHNVFLLMLSEIGLLGFLVFVWWGMTVGKVIVSVFQKSQGFFGIGFCIVIGVLALFDHYLWSLWPGLALSAFTIGMTLRLSLEKD